MKYFIDTEFNEGFKEPFFGKKFHTIDFISIGIVAEDGRTYYAISNEFDLKKVWNKWQKEKCCNMPQVCTCVMQGYCPGYKKMYWLRENVLRSIHADLCKKESNYARTYHHHHLFEPFTLKSMQNLIRWHGKSNKKIAEEIIDFIAPPLDRTDEHMGYYDVETYLTGNPPEFYGYFADYDWVVFCSLFGRMIDLPKGFPMYCRDIKQLLDERAEELVPSPQPTLKDALKFIKSFKSYPVQAKEHHALADADWNKQLYHFLTQI